MALKNVRPGTYRAKALGGVWGFSSEKKTPCVGIQFEFEANGQKEKIWAVRYLSQTLWKNGEKTVMQATFEDLAKIGYREDLPLEKDAQGNQKFTEKHLDPEHEVDIVLDLEANQNDPSKTYLKVQWINQPGGAQMAGVAVEQVLGNVSLAAEMAAARTRLGVKHSAKASAPAAPALPEPLFTEEDLPF